MKGNKSKAVSEVASARRRTGIVSAAVVITAFVATMLLAAYLILDQNTKTSRQNVYTMNSQLSKGVQNKLDKLEDVTTRVFQQKNYIEYDASVYDRNRQYTSLQLEKEISEFLTYMSTTDNYNDFCLLYANDHTVGRVSNASNKTFESGMYRKLSGYIGDKSKLWITGIGGDFERLYFLRRVNSGTLFVGSMFTDDLDSVFPEDTPNHLSFTITDDSGNIIYSINRSKVTDNAVKKLMTEWREGEPVAVESIEYAAASASCGSDWHVISVSDFSSRNKGYLRIAAYCGMILAAAVIVVFFAALLLSSSRIPTNLIYRSQYSTESLDKLTGLIMNEALDNVIVEKIDSCINGTTLVLLLVKIKNFDLIRENYGESAVDEAIVKTSAVLREFYGKNNIVGKTGENEFAVLADFTDFNLFKAHERIRDNVRQLEAELEKLELENERGMIKCSLGACVYPDDSDDYDVLYENAQAALKESEQAKVCKCKFYKDLPKEGETKKQ